MKKKYFNPVSERFLVQEELLQTISSFNSAKATPRVGDSEDDDIVPSGLPIDDNPIGGSDDFKKGGLSFE